MKYIKQDFIGQAAHPTEFFHIGEHKLMLKTKTHLLVTILSLIYFFSCFSLAGCGREKVEAVNDIQEITAQRKSDFETIKADAKEVFDEVKSIGIVEAFREVQISPETSGKVKKIYCDVGDGVKQGELLAELDGESRLIALKKTKAMLKKADASHKKVKRDTKRADSLFNGGVISDSEYDGAHLERKISDADLDLAGAEVMDAEKKLRETKVRAPFAGKVALRDTEIGATVKPGQTLFTIVDISKVKIAVNLSEFDATKISVGNTARVHIDSLPEAVFSGKVYTIGLKADEATRTFPVEIVVSNSEEKILPGMVARVCVKSSKPRRVVVVPREAITTAGGKRMVSLLKDGKIEQRSVVTGPLFNDQVIVKKGLKGDEEIIVLAKRLRNESNAERGLQIAESRQVGSKQQ
jgi:membrane fusion protein (multidrug efflux system)